MLQTALASLLFLAVHAGIASSTPHQFPVHLPADLQSQSDGSNTDFCPQFPAQHPAKHHALDVTLESVYKADNFTDWLIHALSTVVRVP